MLAAKTVEYKQLYNFLVDQNGKAIIVDYDGYDIGNTTNFDYEFVLTCILTGVFTLCTWVMRRERLHSQVEIVVTPLVLLSTLCVLRTHTAFSKTLANNSSEIRDQM